MAHDDSGADKTVMRPRPGGNRSSGDVTPPGSSTPANPSQGSAPRPPPLQQAVQRPAPAPLPSLDSIKGAGSNGLTIAAAPLFVLLSQLRRLPSHDDVNGLRQQIIVQVQKFEAEAQASGASPVQVASARYVLCATLDEAVLSTPWGNRSIWTTQTLLTIFHQEAWGGEKFFQILDRLKQDAASNLDLLELMYLCLALGFEGKYKVQDQGAAQLAGVQDQLYHLIRQHRGDFERPLSPNWRGVEDRRNPLARYVPLWVVAVTVVALLLSEFIGFRIGLTRSSQPIDEALAGIGLPDLTRPADIGLQAPVPQIRLKTLLADAEAQGLLAILEDGGRTTITLQGDNLFASGSAEVNRDLQPVLEQIGNALNDVPGPAHVYGHTDNVPIRSLKFQSNWDLSRERAIDVTKIIAASMKVPTRLTPQGLADTRPVEPNDSAQGRARNRRVEIVHTAQAAAQ